MNICILGSKHQVENTWLVKEAKKRGHTAVSLSTTDISFAVKGNTFSILSKYSLENFDIFLVRGIFRSYLVNDVHFNKSTEYFLLLRYIHNILKKPIVDERLATQPFILSKMATSLTLCQHGVPQPQSFQFVNKKQVRNFIDKLPYPIIVKNPAGTKGKNIYKFDTKQDLLNFLEKMPEVLSFQFQKYLPTDGDIRVLVIGFKAIGAMKRYVVPGDFRSNISQGAKAQPYKLTKPLRKIAESAAEATSTEYAGVDIIESKDKFYVIEVNRAPQFRGFRKYTGIDPSPFIIDYLEQKAQKKN